MKRRCVKKLDNHPTGGKYSHNYPNAMASFNYIQPNTKRSVKIIYLCTKVLYNCKICFIVIKRVVKRVVAHARNQSPPPPPLYDEII